VSQAASGSMQAVVHRAPKLLLAPEVALGRLNRGTSTVNSILREST
jgi:hypothetical protein